MRCFGGPEDKLMMKYHDEEWGVPVHDDRLLFEFLCLEGAQAGLSWATILSKRDNYRQAFHNFDVTIIAKYSDSYKDELLRNSGIVRNERKVAAIINNAKVVLRLKEALSSFGEYVWSFSGHKVLRESRVERFSDLPTRSQESCNMAVDMKQKGLLFVGPVVCYSYMQAIGMVDDHLSGCFRSG